MIGRNVRSLCTSFLHRHRVSSRVSYKACNDGSGLKRVCVDSVKDSCVCLLSVMVLFNPGKIVDKQHGRVKEKIA